MRFTHILPLANAWHNGTGWMADPGGRSIRPLCHQLSSPLGNVREVISAWRSRNKCRSPKTTARTKDSESLFLCGSLIKLFLRCFGTHMSGTWWMKRLDLFSTWMLSTRNSFSSSSGNFTFNDAWLITILQIALVSTNSCELTGLFGDHVNTGFGRDCSIAQPNSFNAIMKM